MSMPSSAKTWVEIGLGVELCCNATQLERWRFAGAGDSALLGFPQFTASRRLYKLW